jgi:hypothetical protein
MAKGKTKTPVEPVPYDVQRDHILRFLYERHESARSPTKILVGIQDLRGELKKRHGMTQQDVSSNLDYLVQVGWVREVAKDRSFTTPRGMEVSKEQIKYKISDIGINHLQAGTMFKKPDAVSHVNITNIKGVTVVGDGNIVNTEFTELSRALDRLDQEIGRRRDLSDEQKLDVAADLSTIRAQIAKRNPSREIVRAVWHSLEAVATLSGVSDALTAVKHLLGPLLGSN